MAARDVPDRASILQAEVSALNDLLATHEGVVIDQSAKLEQAFQECSASQQRWQCTFNASPIGLMLLDENTVIIAVNDAAAKLAAKNRADMVGRQPGDALGCRHALEQRGRCGRRSSCAACPIRALIEDAFKTGQSARGLEVRPGLIVGGVQVKPWLEISVEPVRIAERPHLVLSISDITWRKQAEEALRQSEERFRILFESSRDAMMTGAAPSGEFTAGNSAALAMFRARSEQEFLACAPADLSPERQPDGRLSGEKAGEMIATAMRNGSHFFEWTHKRLDGEEFPANVLLTRVEQAGQSFILGTVRDITAPKRAEEALRAAQQIIEGIINTIPARIFWKDNNLVYLGCNAVFAHDAGFTSPEDLVGKDDYQMGWRDRAELYRADDRQVIESGCPKLLIEEPLTTPEGKTITLLTSKVPLRSSTGETIGVLGTFMDITDRKRAEEALKAKTADLERANEEVKQFAYIVSHDFRAPLVNLKGFAGEIRSSLSAVASALEAARPHLGEEQRKAAVAALQTDVPEALHFIETAASNMDNYVNALLKLSRLGRQELHPERLRVAEIVERSLKSLAHQIGERGVTVSVGPLPEVVADRTALRTDHGQHPDQCRALPATGPAGPDRSRRQPRPDETTFFVRDNGRGIAPEDMPKVFAPFRRAGKQDVKGEGMGLAYVRTLVHRHGGEIRCESQFGVGTTFTFTLRNSIEKEEHDARTPTNRA